MSDKEYSGYSLYKGGPSMAGPRFGASTGGDWMNPFAGAAMFGGGGGGGPSRGGGGGFFRGAPVVEAPRQQQKQQQHATDRCEGISKQVSVPHHQTTSSAATSSTAPRVPCSNVPTRTLRRVNAFASRDWSSGIMPIDSIDSDLHIAPQKVDRQIAQDVSPNWSSPAMELKETSAKKNIWAFTSGLGGGKRATMGIKAVGESDGDSGPDDDKDDDTWLHDLKETMQLAMQENDEKACFHFEWLAHSNGNNNTASSASPASSVNAIPSQHHSIFHKH